MSGDVDIRPGDWVRCGDRDNWGQVLSGPAGGQVRIRWEGRDGSVATKVKPVPVVTEVQRPGRDGKSGARAPCTSPARPGGALRALHRFRKRSEATVPSRDSRKADHDDENVPCEVWREQLRGLAARSEPSIEKPERIRESRRAETREPRRCWACGGTRFWRGSGDCLVCATCHPPACAGYVKAWIGSEQDGSAT